jgi:nucleotide-binding universal stress UspA family protein
VRVLGRGTLAVYRRILAPIDGSDCAAAGLHEIARVTDQPAHQVLLIHVVESTRGDRQFPPGTAGAIMQEAPDKDGQEILDSAKATLLHWGIRCEQLLVESGGQSIAQVIVSEASRWNAELILMGTHGLRGFSRIILGSVAGEVVGTAKMPVLLVRPTTD